MQMPVDIAYRHCQPSERVRAEIEAQTRRLNRVGRDITTCRVVVSGPGEGHGPGKGFRVRLRIGLPERKEVVVDRTDADPGREHALVAVREAFAVARRRLDDAERELHGEVKAHAPAPGDRSGRTAASGG